MLSIIICNSSKKILFSLLLLVTALLFCNTKFSLEIYKSRTSSSTPVPIVLKLSCFSLRHSTLNLPKSLDHMGMHSASTKQSTVHIVGHVMQPNLILVLLLHVNLFVIVVNGLMPLSTQNKTSNGLPFPKTTVTTSLATAINLSSNK